MYCSSGNKAHRAQGMIEYAVFLSVVVSALLLWQFMIKRSYEGRIKQEIDSVGASYSPGHTIADSTMTTESKTSSYTGGEISRADPLASASAKGRAIDDGVMVSLSNTKTSFTKDEKIDSIKAED